MKNKLFSIGGGFLALALVLASSPPIYAQEGPQSFKKNVVSTSTDSSVERMNIKTSGVNSHQMRTTQLPAAYYQSSWTVVSERIDGTGSVTVSGVDPTSFRIPNTATVGTANRAEQDQVFDNGPHFNVPGNPDLSILESTTLGMDTFGANIAYPDYAAADDFELTAETEITSIDLYTYQTGASGTSINEVYVQIWDGDPSGSGTVIWGDMSTNVFSSVESSGAYRVSETAQTDRSRLIQRVTAGISGLTLDAGTYYLEYSLGGTAASGPWQAPVAILGQDTTGDALQRTPAGWQALLDSGNNTPQGVPFQVYGNESGTGGGPFPDPYCDIEDGDEVIVEAITAVEFAGVEIVNNDHSSVLVDKTDIVVDIVAGETYTISVQGDTSGNFETNIVAFIDWNQNGILDDAGEVYEIGVLENTTGNDGVSVTAEIEVPADAVPGQTRVRITKTYFDEDSDPIINPCGIQFDPWGMGVFAGFGQALDFTVDVEEQGTGGGPFPDPYCEVSGITSVEAISRVVFADIDNASDPNGTVIHEDFTHVVGQVNAGETYSFAGEGNTKGSWTNHFTVWIDWNQDGVFDESTERYNIGSISNSNGSDGQQAVNNIEVPSGALEGETRMRVIKTFNSAATSSCVAGTSYGQIEDYTIQVSNDGTGGGDACSQGTASNGIENGWGNAHRLVIANDFVVDEGVEFALEEMAVNFLLQPGLDVISADITFYEDSGNGPGSEITSAGVAGLAPSGDTFLESFAGFELREIVFTLADAPAFVGETGGSVYWMGITIEYNGTSSYIETTSIYNTPNEAYLLENGVWSSGITVFGDDMHGVIEFSGQCTTDGGGSTNDYCIPAGTNASYHIDGFSTTGGTTNISNLGTGFSPDGYGDFYDTHTVAQKQGENVSFLAEFPSGQTYGFRVWVDWNQDGEFDASEEVAWNSSSYGNPQSGSFAVPADATLGETRMRVVGHWLNSSADIDPCATNHTYGEFEDYKFVVEEGTGGGDGCSIEYAYSTDDGSGDLAGLLFADDFIVDSDTMEVDKFTFWIFNNIGEFTTLNIYEDNGGTPGAVVESFSNLAYDSQTAVDENFGFDVYEIVVSLPQSVSLTSGTYWVGVQTTYGSDNTTNYWTVSEEGIGSPGKYSNNGGASWTINTSNYDYAFKVEGVCEGSGGGTGDDCEIDFTASLENGTGNIHTLLFADDFIIEGSMNVDKVTIRTFTNIGQVATLIFFENNNGLPGNIVEEFNNIAPASQTVFGNAFGFDAYDVEIDLPSSVELEEGVYWLGINTTVGTDGGTGYWVISDDGVLEPGKYSTDGGQTWTTNTSAYDYSFKLEGTCEGGGDPGLTYCEPFLDCTDGDVITNVTFQEIDNDSSCSPNGYGDYTSLVATVQSGGTYPISVTVGDGWMNESVSVWIDFDNSGTFDEDEFFYIGTGSDEALVGNVDIPASLADGQYRMRVRVAAVGAGTATWDMSCDEEQGYGETEDYTVEVDNTVGIDDQNQVSFTYYPNPTSGIVNIESNRDITNFGVYNVLGQEVLSGNRLDNNRVDLSSVATGTYVFRVTFEDGSVETFKVVRE